MVYGSGTNTTTNTATGDNNIDALIAQRRWASNQISFSFTDDFINDYEDGYPNSTDHASSFSTLNNQQQTAMYEWIKMYEDVSNLDFIELTGVKDRDATIRIAESSHPPTAYAYLPTSRFTGGDIWFNTTLYDNPIMGSYAYHATGHELGHALGLAHGHEISGYKVRDVPMNSDRDSMEFSIMTYRSYENDPLDGGYSNETWGFAQSLMMYDIRAIQEMYGADFTTNSSDTTYSFSTTTGEMFINGVGQGTPGRNRIFRTLWDGNGIDTYDFSNYTTNLAIDLKPGGWSDLDVGGNNQKANLDFFSGNFARGHVFNALQFNDDSRSLIENAKGGSGDDEIQGNSARNVLRGGLGNDSLSGNDGDDLLRGDAGKDILRGGAGKDTLIGGAGKDILRGGAGKDILIGGAGKDILRGGAGKDIFAFSHSNQLGDKITDFAVQDDIFAFSASGFKGITTMGIVKSKMFTIGTSASSRSHRFIYHASNGDLFYDSDGVGNSQQVKLAKLDANLALTNNHFEIV